MKICAFDYDGTLTTDYSLSSLIPQIVSFCESKGLRSGLCSGRPQSWGEFFVIQTKMEFAIMEGGGVVVMRDGDHELNVQYLTSDEDQAKIREFRESHFELARALSRDYRGRSTDVAYMKSRLTQSEQDRVKQVALDSGLAVDESNVHINIHTPGVDKWVGLQFILKHYGVSDDELLFFGDSLNDEAVFEHGRHTVGVSNISHVRDQLGHLPKTILSGSEGAEALGVLNELKRRF